MVTPFRGRRPGSLRVKTPHKRCPEVVVTRDRRALSLVTLGCRNGPDKEENERDEEENERDEELRMKDPRGKFFDRYGFWVQKDSKAETLLDSILYVVTCTILHSKFFKKKKKNEKRRKKKRKSWYPLSDLRNKDLIFPSQTPKKNCKSLFQRGPFPLDSDNSSRQEVHLLHP